MPKEKTVERKQRIIEGIGRGNYKSVDQISEAEEIKRPYTIRILRNIAEDAGLETKIGGPHKKGIDSSIEKIRDYCERQVNS